MQPALGLYHPLLMAYVGAAIGLALVLLLISSFYRLRLKQPSPRITFVLAVVLGLLHLWSYAFITEGWLTAIRRAQGYLLLAFGICFMLGSLLLYFTMKKRHR
jgi:hypothetical protein